MANWSSVSKDPSSNSNAVYNVFCNRFLENNENKQKECWIGHSVKERYFEKQSSLFISTYGWGQSVFDFIASHRGQSRFGIYQRPRRPPEVIEKNR